MGAATASIAPDGLSREDADRLAAALARMGLTETGEAPALTALAGGVSSLIARADTRRGSVCVKCALPRLKVAAEWLAPVERNSAEVAWMRFAAGIVPAAVPRVMGEDREARAFAMEYLDPAAHPVWKERLRDGVVDHELARAVGRTLAAIHCASAGRPDLAAAFANDANFHALRLEPYLVAAARAHPDCAAALHALVDVTGSTRLALVHGDVSPKNILCGPNGPLLLDAECAWYGDPAFDLAFLLNHMLLKCLWRPRNARAYLSCFATLRDAYLAGVDWETAPVLEERAARLLPGLFLARIDGKSPVEYITTDADRERVRRVARALLLAPPHRLAQVADVWANELGAA